jgi:MFS superfamily sulfate permease-like transporter
VNASAGARSQLSGVVVALVALATMLFLAPLLGKMPHATLAAVVIVYSVGLISPAEMQAILRVRAIEFRWALVAFLGVVLLGTLKGILVAVLVSMLSLMYQSNNPMVYALRRKPGTNIFRPRSPEHPGDEELPGILIARIVGRVYFANAQNVGEKVRELLDEAKPKVLVLDCSAIQDFEYTALKGLSEFEAELRGRGIRLIFAALNPSALEGIRRTTLAETLATDGIFPTVESAVVRYAEHPAV